MDSLEHIPKPVKQFDSLSIMPTRLAGDDKRVIILPFHFIGKIAAGDIFDRVEAMTEKEVDDELAYVMENFGNRHRDIEQHFEENYKVARSIADKEIERSRPRMLLIGAYFTMEYAIEAAALLNPSIVQHPNQKDVPAGSLRFVMSLRAIGEGHVSSTVFRTGIFGDEKKLSFDPISNYPSRTRLSPDQIYIKTLFQRTLAAIGAYGAATEKILSAVPEQFTLTQLEGAIAEYKSSGEAKGDIGGALDSILWVARSNYRLRLMEDAQISELLIFPHSDSESRGIEDMRLTCFIDEDCTTTYYGTYTAYDGFRILPMIIETKDFHHVAVHSLNGACAINKGMALFPRRIKGNFVMCSRIDGRNLFIMYSDNPRFWETAQMFASPKYSWEYRLIGNCGSPIPTKEGWLLITHGVGPVREYSIGAMLLDYDDPTKIRGRLKNPLISPLHGERYGYVPNVVYSCGSLIHNGWLYLPFGIADETTAIATIQAQELIERLIQDGA